MTHLASIGWFLLLVLLMPLLMVGALASVVFIVARHLYWWARGNRASAAG